MSHNVDLSKISFPVYHIGNREPLVDDGVVYFVSGMDSNTEDATYRLSILDDKNVEGKSLAERRLLLSTQGVSLRRITKAIFFLSDFIKLAKGSSWFIDSLGYVFKYKKSRTVKLTYKKVVKIIPLQQGGALVEIEGVPGRHKTLFKPTSTKPYAGVLVDGHTFIFYGLYDRKYKDSHRMI
jgi:hypothetical protein